MAAFDFPSSPSVNQTYTANGVTWKWNGTMWMRITGAGYLEKIEEGDSKVEVDDSGSGNVTVTTDGTERLRITSAGHVRVNTGDLRVGDDTDSNAGTKTISVGSVSSGSGGIGIFANPTNGNSWVQFGDGTSGSDQYRGYMNYQHADDSLRFGTAASEKLRITSAGNLGIGDASPTKPLTVGTTTPVILLDDQSSRTLEIRGPSTTHNATVLTTSTHDLLLGTNNAERLRITSAGQMGLGTNSPNGLLALTAASGRLLTLRNSTTGSGSGDGSYLALNGSDFQIANAESANVILYTADTERLRIDSSGRLLLGLNSSIGGNAIFQVQGSGNKKAQFHQPDGGNCHIQFTNTTTGTSTNNGIEVGMGGDEQAQIWNYYNSYFRIGTNNTERLRVTSDGNVLIGTNTGTERLCIKRDDAVGPTITLENNTIKTYINNWGSSGPTGRTNRFEINATVQAQASICAPYITFMTGGAGDSNEKIRITSDGDLKSGEMSISAYCNTHSITGYSAFLSDNHANTFFGQNLRLGNSGGSGNHQLKVINQHANIGGAGMLIGGNGSPNRNELNFYTVAANQPAGTRVDDTNKRLTIRTNGDITVRGTNSQYVEAAAFQITAASKNAIVSNNGGFVSFESLRNTNSTIISHDPNSNSGRRITFPVAGAVHFSMYQDIRVSGTTGYTQGRLYKNGTADRYSLITYTNDQWDTIMMNTVVEVAANDYLEFYYTGGTITSMDNNAWLSYNFVFYPINTNRG